MAPRERVCSSLILEQNIEVEWRAIIFAVANAGSTLWNTGSMENLKKCMAREGDLSVVQVNPQTKKRSIHKTVKGRRTSGWQSLVKLPWD